MLILTGLRAYLADILTIQLENLDEEGCKKADDMAMILKKESVDGQQPCKLLSIFWQTLKIL